MKLIHLTDTHLVAPGKVLYGLDTAGRLAAAVEHIQARHSDASACIITGDLAHRGESEAYLQLRELLLPLSMPVFLLLGNHDHRGRFLEVFPEVPCDSDGFVQCVHDTPEARFVMLDTAMQSGASGHPAAGYFGGGRLEWLRARLDEVGERDVYLFMHHPPFGVGVRAFDDINMVSPDAQAFADLVRRRENVRHLFFGHIHRSINGTWCGISFSTLPATAHQSLLDFVAMDDLFTHEPPAYGVVLLNPEQVIIHTEFYLHRGPIYHPDGRCVRY